MAILDASFLIDLEQGRDPAVAALDQMFEEETPVRVPAQAAAEYVAGFEDPVANLHDIERSYHVVDYGREQILETARLAEEAFSEGVFPGWADIQVAAQAVLSGEPVVTADPGHFEGLDCRVWAYRDDASPPAGSGEPDSG